MTALASAIKAALEAADIPTGIGVQPDSVGAKPYIVIWPDVGAISADTMKARDGLAEVLVCHSYGLTPESAEVANRKLTAAVYGLHRQVIGSRLVQFPEQLSAVPLSRDDDVNPPLFNLSVEWRFRTSPSE